MSVWEDNFREAAEAKGFADGFAQGLIEGRAQALAQDCSELLVKMARQEFGEMSAAEMAALLQGVRSREALDAAVELLLTCHSGEEFLSRIREI